MNDYRKNWPLPDEFLIEIGRLSSLWVGLEFALNYGIAKLSGFNDLTDPRPFILTTHSSFPQRIDILGALCEMHLPSHPSLGNYAEVISIIKSAQKIRNKFIHNAISFDPNSGSFKLAKASARQTIKASVEDITFEDIHKGCRELHAAHLALHDLIYGVKSDPVWIIK